MDVLAELRKIAKAVDEGATPPPMKGVIAAVAALIVREQVQRELLAEILDDLQIGASPQLYAGRIRDLLAITPEARRHV
ncbi:hypothetical protein [Lysobacter enzymogenes]|uniref:hypothetical protein n=1 Tax=Lysobacter enzymogenes TaxID=69 RepID=UPI00099CCFE7|nr:hypothetical protein [Lysobacter enzymogenes]UZW62731.1 hypothetical protein BV903_010750 [Lysobacter enzymogenes]